MNVNPISCNNLQSLFANISHNTVDFNSQVNNTLLFNREVQNFIQNTFKSIGINQFALPFYTAGASNLMKETIDKYDPSLFIKNPTQNVPIKTQNIKMDNSYLSRFANEDPALMKVMLKSTSYPTLGMSKQRMLSQNDIKRWQLNQLQNLSKFEDKHLVQKKIKMSLSSPSEIQVKHEAYFQPKIEEIQEAVEVASLMYNDQPKEILNVHVDRETGTTWYFVEWHRRQNGLKPKNSYVRREDIIREHSDLVVSFFERQLISKVEN